MFLQPPETRFSIYNLEMQSKFTLHIQKFYVRMTSHSTDLYSWDTLWSWLLINFASRDSAVSIATTYEVDNKKGRNSSPSRVKNFLFSTSSRPDLAFIQLPSQWVSGALSPAVKRPGREADHSPPSTAEVKKTRIYASTPPYVFMA
jgi:hypothetical protein